MYQDFLSDDFLRFYNAVNDAQIFASSNELKQIFLHFNEVHYEPMVVQAGQNGKDVLSKIQSSLEAVKPMNVSR